MMFRNYLISILFVWSGQVCAGSFSIAEQQLKDLRAQRSELADKVKKIEGVGVKIEAKLSEKKSASASAIRLETESKQAKLKLEKLQDFDRENPGDITAEQLRAAVDRNKQAFRQLKEAKEKIIEADATINNVLVVEAENNYADFKRLKSSFERDVDRVVDAQLQDRIRNIQVSKEVVVTERVSCGEDSISVCKERSKKAAEQKASERGSVVFVQSMTEVKNYQLSKEELRSEVQANLTDKVFSNQHIVGEADYETTIKASVTPVISDNLRKQMADNLRTEVYSMVGGKVELVKNPSEKIVFDASKANNAQGEEEKEPLPVKKSKPKPIVIEEDEEPAVIVRRRAAPAPTPAQPSKPAMPSFSF
jgi:hypothetical protein